MRLTFALGKESGERIKEARTQLGLSQAELGNICSIRRETILRYENGTLIQISQKNLRALCEALKLTQNYLLGETKAEPKERLETKTVGKDNVVDVGEGFPQRVKNTRKQLGLSQEQLAIQASISKRTVIRIENGQVLPSVKTFYGLRNALQVETMWLYGSSSEDRLLTTQS